MNGEQTATSTLGHGPQGSQGKMIDICEKGQVVCESARRTPTLLHRAINLFYRSKAVSKVQIPGRNSGPRRWRIELYSGNDPELCRGFLANLKPSIQAARQEFGFVPPDELVIHHPGSSEVVV